MDMSDFQSRGGHLNGREERMDQFDGCPRDVHGIDTDKSGSTVGALNGDRTTHSSTTGTSGLGSTTTTGTHSQGIPDIHSHNASGTHSHGTTASPYTTSSTQGSSTTPSKPSLKDKLNPKVDADGDGKPGIMN